MVSIIDKLIESHKDIANLIYRILFKLRLLRINKEYKERFNLNEMANSANIFGFYFFRPTSTHLIRLNWRNLNGRILMNYKMDRSSQYIYRDGRICGQLPKKY